MWICCLREKKGDEKRRELGWEVFFSFSKGGKGGGGGRREGGEVSDYV